MALALLAILSLNGCGASTTGNQDEVGDQEENEPEGQDLVWKCAETPTSCVCNEVSEDSVLVSFDAREVDGCWGRECCILKEATEDSRAKCECVTSDSSCEELVASMRNAQIVSECAPGSVPDLDRYAVEGERCDGTYLSENDLWACRPETYCGMNEARLRTCVEGTEETRAVDAACRTAAGNTTTSSSTLELSEPVVIWANGIEYRMTAVDSGFFDKVDSDGCLESIGATFSTGEAGAEQTKLELAAEAVDGVLVVSKVYFRQDKLPALGESAPPSALETEPANIPFTVSTFGQTCQDFGGRCLVGSVEWHLRGKVGEVEFAETTISVDATVCSSLALTTEGICPSPVK
jgi:hypothetical protein